MNVDEIVRYASQAMIVCLLVSLPAVATSALIGLLVAFFQAVTSLQDSSISYGIKLLVVSAAVALSASWAGSQVVAFSQSLFQVAFRP